MHSASPQQQLTQSLITAGVVALVLVLRLRGLNRERPFRVELVWIMPAILLAMTAWLLSAFPPRDASGWAILAVVFVVGAVPGWWRGKLIPIWRDPQQGLRTKSSLAAIIFLLILFAVRAGARFLLETERVAWNIDPRMIDVGFLVLALGLLGVSRVEMALRALKLQRHPADAAA